MDRAQLIRQIDAVSRLRGQFRLRSGAVSDEYFDKYRFESDPRLLAAIADGLAPLIPAGIDALAGLELGGVPIATALALRTGLPAVFVRKQAKSYGTCQFAEGLDVSGKRLLIVEDVITSGGQVVASCTDLRRSGATIENVVCVIDRQAGGPAALRAANLELRALLTKSDLDEIHRR